MQLQPCNPERTRMGPVTTALSRLAIALLLGILGAAAIPNNASAVVDPTASGTLLDVRAREYTGLSFDGDWVVGLSWNGAIAQNVVTREVRVISAEGRTILGRPSRGIIDRATVGEGTIYFSEWWQDIGWQMRSYNLTSTEYSDPIPDTWEGLQGQPSRAGDWLVYTYGNGAVDWFADIYATNVSTGEVRKLGTYGGYNPETDGRYVVWYQYDSYFYVYDLLTGSLDYGYRGNPNDHLSVDSGRMAFLDGPVMLNGIAQSQRLTVMNLATWQKSVVAEVTPAYRAFDLHGDWIVWEVESPSSGLDVIAKNLVTGEVRAVCRAEQNQEEPKISGTTVVWRDRRDITPGSSDEAIVGFARLEDCPPLDLQGPSLTATSSLTPTVASLSIEATDNVGVRRIAYRNGDGPISYVDGDRETLRFDKPGSYRLQYWAEDMQLNPSEVRTLEFTIKSAPSVGTPVAPSFVSADRTFSAYAVLKPKHPAETKPVRLYVDKYSYATKKWARVRYFTATAYNMQTASKCVGRMKLSKGRWRLRAYTVEDTEHLVSRSPGYAYLTAR